MNTFDFYDTLFTRLVALPTGIFLLMEEILDDPGFAAKRTAAELAARRFVGGQEVNLEGIYSQLNLTTGKKAEIIQLELQLERELIVPIVANLARVYNDDLVVSDMYLPASLLQSILVNHRKADVHPKVIVSNEMRLKKSDGSLWNYLRKEYTNLHLHVGDNRKSDVIHPCRMGLKVEHFRGAELNRYERRLIGRGTLDEMLIAGLSRATRLSLPLPLSNNRIPDFKAIDAIFSSVIAPLLVAFVEKVIDDAEQQGINQLYFLARDGQLLHRIATAIIDARQLALQANYIYGSRHALHLPGLTSLNLAETWLLENTPHLSLADIAKRGELPPDLIIQVGRRFGFNSYEANIPNARRSELKSLIRAPEIEAQLRMNSESKLHLALEYYRQVGMISGSRVILVDVGWTGRMQSSLRALLNKSGDSPISLCGHYLCLSSKLKVSDYDTLNGFLHDPDVTEQSCPFDPYRCVVESCLMADHGTTLGFQCVDGIVQPILGDSPATEERIVIERQQATVLHYVQHMLKIERIRGKRIVWSRDALSENLLQMLRFPYKTDANAFVGISFSEGQADNRKQDIVKYIGSGRNWLRRQSLGLWPEGSLTMSGRRFVLRFVRAARWLKLHA